jgi:hypothetical protein
LRVEYIRRGAVQLLVGIVNLVVGAIPVKKV